MSQVRQGSNGSGQRPTSTTSPTAATRVEKYLTIRKDEALWGWTTLWLTRQIDDNLRLVLIPKLCLEQIPTFQLVHVRSLPDVFKGCSFVAQGIQNEGFTMYGGSFMLYRTGRPEMHNVITALGGEPGDLAKIIRLGTEALT